MADGIRVDFVVREQLYFNRVVIHGLVSPPSEASAVAAMQLPLGEPYQRETVNEGLERLREVLRDEGFFTAKVTADTEAHPQEHQMEVVVNVQPGPRARVKEIQLRNGTEYPDKEILVAVEDEAGAGDYFGSSAGGSFANPEVSGEKRTLERAGGGAPRRI